jgi:hypothetical protein
VPSSPRPADLSKVSAALRDAPEFLAGWLDSTPDGEDLLRHRLSLSDTQLHRLLTCRAPDPLHFTRDVQALADFIEVPDTKLAATLREAGVLAALRTRAGSTATAEMQPVAGLLAAARDDVVEQIPRSAPAVRVRELAAATWAAAPERVRQQRDVEAAVVWASPVVIVSMPHLQMASANRWLAENGAPALPDGPGDLRGLLVAWRGFAAIFLDGTMTAAERRFTLAHEHGHFLLDYLLRRQRILRDAPGLLDVIDGHRPPTDADRAKASLARVPIGLHTHLLHRDDHGGAGGSTMASEDDASLYALELLSPWDSLLRLLRSRALPSGTYPDRLASATEAVVSEFTLPHDAAQARAAAGLEAIGVKRGFFDR